ncbi:MAG: WbqC family protein [Holosporaceae bacterium]|jgi:hypothetical protein|nr:WbqC family protein [Holosporaceae bacterium]
MKAAIMQPSYIPWVGYFALMKKVDTFVFLDDVKVVRRSWDVRNRILVHGKPLFLTVPVLGGSEQNLCDIVVDMRQCWLKKHVRTLERNYSRHRYINDVLQIMTGIHIDERSVVLSQLTSSIVIKFARNLKIDISFLFSSQLNVGGKRSEKLVNILKEIGCNCYISPIGAKEYIEEDGILRANGIHVEYHDYIPIQYPQVNSKEFIPFLSIVDLVANVGFDAAIGYI